MSGKPSGVYRGDDGERRLFQLMAGSGKVVVGRASGGGGKTAMVVAQRSVDKRIWAGWSI